MHVLILSARCFSYPNFQRRGNSLGVESPFPTLTITPILLRSLLKDFYCSLPYRDFQRVGRIRHLFWHIEDVDNLFFFLLPGTFSSVGKMRLFRSTIPVLNAVMIGTEGAPPQSLLDSFHVVHLLTPFLLFNSSPIIFLC